ncbi:MAG: cation:proton antiporter [Euryarchaeota archaeon]|nr:cation:proton antiporter [Euryarchaeota archaeon]
MTILEFIFYGFLISAALVIIRVIRGPTAPDRVVAMDPFVTMMVVLLVVTSFLSARSIYLDIALVIAILGFIGTVAVSKYLEGGELKEGVE